MARVLTVTSIVLAAGLLVGVVGAAVSSINSTRSAEAKSLSFAANRPAAMFDRSQTAVMLSRVNITPKTMAAAGLTAEEAQQVIGRMMVHLAATNNNGQVQAATRAANAAEARAVRFPRPAANAGAADQPTTTPPAVSPPAVTPPVVDTLPTARQARATINGMLDLAFSYALQELPTSKQERLINLRRNLRWSCPLPFAVVPPSTRSEQDWLKLKAAIAHVGSAAQNNLQPESGPLAIFNTADSDSRVTAARADSAANLVTIREAWDELLGEP